MMASAPGEGERSPLSFESTEGFMRFRLVVLFVLTAGVGLALPGLTAPTLAAGTCSGWRIVPSPKIGNDNYGRFFGVSALTSHSAWTVGFGYLNGSFRNRAEYWNGTSWNIHTTPNLAAGDNEQLEGVAALSPPTVWAVGYSD